MKIIITTFKKQKNGICRTFTNANSYEYLGMSLYAYSDAVKRLSKESGLLISEISDIVMKILEKNRCEKIGAEKLLVVDNSVKEDPKKVVKKINKKDLKLGKITFKRGVITYWCPECDMPVSGSCKYCPNCGQKLDWKDKKIIKTYK